MSVRRSVIYAGLTFSFAALAFSFGSWSAQRSMAQQLANNDARVSALRDDMARSILADPSGGDGGDAVGDQRPPAGGRARRGHVAAALSSTRSSGSCRARWDCCRCSCCATARRASSSSTPTTSPARSSYGTAGYLGNGYFVTVKHGVVALDERPTAARRRKITSIKIRVHGQRPAGAARRRRRRRRRSALGRLGDHPRERDGGPAAAARRTRSSATTSPIRSFALATTTPRASSSAPATSDSGRRTAS